MSIDQTANGSNNIQSVKIFNRPLEIIDVCSEKIGTILETISNIDFFAYSTTLVPPEINLKNIVNKIDQENAIEIELTYALWNDITEAIRLDSSGLIAKNYHKSAFLLNQLYLAKFKFDFPGFKLHAVSIYCQNTGTEADDAYLLIHLLHYMYLSCQVGLKP